MSPAFLQRKQRVSSFVNANVGRTSAIPKPVKPTVTLDRRTDKALRGACGGIRGNRAPARAFFRALAHARPSFSTGARGLRAFPLHRLPTRIFSGK